MYKLPELLFALFPSGEPLPGLPQRGVNILSQQPQHPKLLSKETEKPRLLQDVSSLPFPRSSAKLIVLSITYFNADAPGQAFGTQG